MTNTNDKITLEPRKVNPICRGSTRDKSRGVVLLRSVTYTLVFKFDLSLISRLNNLSFTSIFPEDTDD